MACFSMCTHELIVLAQDQGKKEKNYLKYHLVDTQFAVVYTPWKALASVTLIDVVIS